MENTITINPIEINGVTYTSAVFSLSLSQNYDGENINTNCNLRLHPVDENYKIIPDNDIVIVGNNGDISLSGIIGEIQKIINR